MRLILVAAIAAVSLAGCRADTTPAADSQRAALVAPVLDSKDAIDTHSYAKPLEARVTNVSLDLSVDFDAKRLAGTAALDIERKADARQLILDDKGLEIRKVTDAQGAELDYKVGPADAALGSPLAITLKPDTRKIVITYASAPDAEALQWLTPQQTAGKKHPYLFSQGQAILNRTWIPTQDSPGIRQTWDATIRVPAPLTTVMSAPKASEPMTQGGERIFKYRMDKPVAPYLIAIAVGDLAFRELGSRTGVWTEPAMLDSAAAELADTEKMVDAAEKLFGPYRWGRYDLLVLPPSFPFGGMENPTLTFLTPTFIAGDKSLVSLIAHELAHSWSGNLATNATWSDFWLNEGLTTYAERRIVEAVYGEKTGRQQVALGVAALNEAIAENGGPNGPDTRLHIDLSGRNPDEGTTDIAYEKGAAFLRTIEAAVGRERFDAFLRGWFDRHAFKPVTSAMFLAELREQLVKGDTAQASKLALEEWIYQPGIPSNAAPADPAAFGEIDSALRDYQRTRVPAVALWGRANADERLRYLNGLPRKLTASQLEELGRAFGLETIGNNELKFAWLDLVIANRYDPSVPALEQFLTAQGRRKFVRPLFTALAADKEWGVPIARRLVPKVRPLYHPLTQSALDELKLAP